MKIIPIWDRVIVKVHEPKEEVQKGPLILVTEKKKPRYEVVAVSHHAKDIVSSIEFPFEVGDFVLLERHYGHEIIEDKERFLILRADDIIAFESKTDSCQE